MNKASPPFSQSEAEAAIWLARLHADDRSVKDERTFHEWMRSDTANEAAFAQLTAVWELAGAAPRITEPAQPMAEASTRVSRRALVMASLGAIVAIGGTTYWQAASATIYETELGEQKNVSLSDGTLLILDTDTRVQVAYSDSKRSITLVRGRCNFRIAPDPVRPFEVDAAGSRIVATQANLDIRNDDKKVQVTCISGHATVAGNTTATGAGLLRAGERMTAPQDAVAQIDRPDIYAQSSWQAGQLIFEDETLAQAAAEMNRYSSIKLIVEDPNAASLRLSGAYRAGDNAQFARSVQKLLPVSANLDNGAIRLSASTGI